MTGRSAPFTGNKTRLANDLGKAWAWCEYVHSDLKPFTLVSGVLDLGDQTFGFDPGIEEAEYYFDCGPLRDTALDALAAMGHHPAPDRWYAHYPTAFVFARRLSAHECLQALAFFRARGLTSTSSNQGRHQNGPGGC